MSKKVWRYICIVLCTAIIICFVIACTQKDGGTMMSNNNTSQAPANTMVPSENDYVNDPTQSSSSQESDNPKATDEPTEEVSKPSTGGFPGNSMTSIMNGGYYCTDGEWDYMVLRSIAFYDSALYKINTVSEECVQLADHGMIFMNLADDWIYYCVFDEGIFRLKKDGSIKEQLLNGKCRYMLLVGDKIYYIDGSKEDRLYSMDTDGNNAKAFLDMDSYMLQYVDGYLYFTSYTGTTDLYRVNISNINEVEKIAENVMKYVVYDNSVYFLQYNEAYVYDLNKMNIGEKEPSVLMDNIYVDFFIENNKIYFTKPESEIIYTMDLEGNNVTEYFKGDAMYTVRSIYAVVNDTVYYWIIGEEGGAGSDMLARVNSDGTFTLVSDIIGE
jgi:hypothetical protein